MSMESTHEILTLLVALLVTKSKCADQSPVFFIVEPVSVTVPEGHNVTLTCEAGPRGTVDIQWIYKGMEISAVPTTASLAVDGSKLYISSRVTDSAEIRCIARSRVGAILSRPAIVDFFRLDPVVQEEKSQLISAAEGNTVILPFNSRFAKAYCLSIELHVNGMQLPLSSRHRVLPSNNVQIQNINISDGGSYQWMCSTSSDSQKVVVGSALLRVENSSTQAKSEFVWTSPRNTRVVEGQTLTLECAAVGYPVPQVTWSRYGGVLPPNRHSQRSGILTIIDAHKTDEGTYICSAENAAGAPKLHVVLVDVLQSARIVSPPVVRVAAQGSRVSFTCKARGSPKPVVMWYHNAVPVTSNHLTKIFADGALVLIEVAENQSGIYQCIVSNSVSSSSATARLAVHPDPGMFNQTLSPGRETLTSSSAGRVVPDAKYKNSLPVHVSNSEKEAFSSKDGKSHMQSDGERRPVPKKPKGTRTYEKAQQRKPFKKTTGLNLVPPSKPSTKLISDSSVELKWTVGETNGLNVTLLKVQFKQVKTLSHRKSSGWHTIEEDIAPGVREFTIKNLKPGSTYQFRLVAIYSNNDNKHGPNSNRVFMSVSGQQVKVPLTTPIIVAVTPLSTSEISVSWQFMPSKREIVDGFMVHYKPYETNVSYNRYAVHGNLERDVILSDLLEDTMYSFRMQSFNSEGFSDYSNTAVKKTIGPSDNNTDADFEALNNHTPLFPPVGVDDLFHGIPNFGGSVSVPHSMGTTSRSGIESHVPMGRSYSQQNKDLLFVVLGIVLGAVFVVIIFVVVFCFWRQRQQQLLIVALQSQAKSTGNALHPLNPSNLATVELKDYDGGTTRSSNLSYKSRTVNKKDHIPNHVGNGCSMNGRPGATSYRGDDHSHVHRPGLETDNLMQRLSVSNSTCVCDQYTCRSGDRGVCLADDNDCANSNYESRSDASDADSVSSECHMPWLSADCSAIYNLEASRISSQNQPSEICQRSRSNCFCDQFSCLSPGANVSAPSSAPSSASLPNPAKCREPGQSGSSTHSCSSHCSSAFSVCQHQCHDDSHQVFATNDSGIYDEQISGTAVECQRHSDTDLGTDVAASQHQAIHNRESRLADEKL